MPVVGNLETASESLTRPPNRRHFTPHSKQDIVEVGGPDGAPPAGRLLYKFDHEVRCLHHPRFMRPLYNRQGAF